MIGKTSVLASAPRPSTVMLEYAYLFIDRQRSNRCDEKEYHLWAFTAALSLLLGATAF